LDKDDRLNEYTKSKLVDDILRYVKNRLNKDTTHVNTLNSLLKKAKTAGFTNDFKTRIINSALVRAKALVPEERKKAVSLALGKKVNDNKERKPEKKVERERKRESPNNNKKEVKELSDLDVLRA